jgi:hypothetical protein
MLGRISRSNFIGAGPLWALEFSRERLVKEGSYKLHLALNDSGRDPKAERTLSPNGLPRELSNNLSPRDTPTLIRGTTNRTVSENGIEFPQ